MPSQRFIPLCPIFIFFFLACDNKDQQDLEQELIYPETIQFTTQTQIDEFGSQGYTTVLGSVFVGEVFNTLPIYNLDGLSNLRKIEGAFALRGNTQVKDLKGLENLTSLGALILQNSNLENLEELSRLSSLDSDNIISSIVLNDNLSNLEGLRNITTIDAVLSIENNLKLINLSGLESLESVAMINIWSNQNLTSLDGLSNLKVVSGNYFDVRTNERLTDYCAVKTIFRNNPNLVLTTLLNSYNPTIEDIISGKCSQ